MQIRRIYADLKKVIQERLTIQRFLSASTLIFSKDKTQRQSTSALSHFNFRVVISIQPLKYE